MKPRLLTLQGWITVMVGVTILVGAIVLHSWIPPIAIPMGLALIVGPFIGYYQARHRIRKYP